MAPVPRRWVTCWSRNLVVAGIRAVRARQHFSPRTGLPEAETTDGETITWYEHARAYTEIAASAAADVTGPA
jgi:hypothetical protein